MYKTLNILCADWSFKNLDLVGKKVIGTKKLYVTQFDICNTHTYIYIYL